MKKIPSLFARDGAELTTDYNPLASWVVSGDGTATRKWDGTAARWHAGQLWARYDAKRGKPLPPGFDACQDPDPITGHHPGWVPASRPEDKWIRSAAESSPWQGYSQGEAAREMGVTPQGVWNRLANMRRVGAA